MTIIKTNLYSFDEVKNMLGVSAERLFQLSVFNPPITQGNRLYYDRSQVRKLVLMKDGEV